MLTPTGDTELPEYAMSGSYRFEPDVLHKRKIPDVDSLPPWLDPGEW